MSKVAAESKNGPSAEAGSQLLQELADPQARQRAFFEAVQDGDCTRVRRLLDAKANGTLCAASGQKTAAHLAAATNRVDVLKLLLVDLKWRARGGGVDATDAFGNTPLIESARGGHIESLKLLLSLQADCNVETLDFRQTPVLFAARAGSAECVAALMHAKADISGYKTLLSSAARAPTPDVLQYLFERDPEKFDAHVMARTIHGNSLLHEAARHRRPANVSLLLQLKADVNAINKARHTEDPTAFFVACRVGSVECLEALLAAGADTECTKYGGQTALQCAARSGKASIVRLLCERGIGGGINKPDKAGDTALHGSVRARQLESARVLIEMRADVHAKNKVYGATKGIFMS